MKGWIAPGALVLAGCASGVPTDLMRPDVAVVRHGYSQDTPAAHVLLQQGATLYPAMINGELNWCSREIVIFAKLGPGSYPACFVDRSRSGRFTRMWHVAPLRVESAGTDVNVPYELLPRA